MNFPTIAGLKSFDVLHSLRIASRALASTYAFPHLCPCGENVVVDSVGMKLISLHSFADL